MNTHKDSLIKEIVINAPLAKVWKAITDKEDMKQWYFDLSDFKPEAGFEFQFSGKGRKGEMYVHLCKVLEVIPFRKLRYSWTYEGFEGYSVVTFELVEEGKGTKVKLTHDGIDSFATDNPDFGKESFNEGWTYLIQKALKEFSEEEKVNS